MTFDDYQEQSRKTAQYPNLGDNYIYPALGLGGEAGEVLNKIKKVQRDKGGVMDDAARAAVADEISDCFWYLAQLCTELGLSMNQVAENNLKKLFDRLERGVIKGDGDKR